VDWQPPWNGGRNHYGKVFSVLVAGGGFKGGRIVGSSDAKGEEVKERPVYRSICWAASMNWLESIRTPVSRIRRGWMPACCRRTRRARKPRDGSERSCRKKT
jgi:hypothetical protein